MSQYSMSPVKMFKPLKKILLSVGLLYLGLFPFITANAAPVPVIASDPVKNDPPFVQITDATIRAVPTGTVNTAAYFNIKNLTKTPVVLERVTSPLSDRVEIHTTEIDDDVARMVRQESVIIAANRKVRFKSGGLHLMIMNMKKAPMQGDAMPLTLHFNDDRSVTVKAVVKMQMEMNSHGGYKH